MANSMEQNRHDDQSAEPLDAYGLACLVEDYVMTKGGGWARVNQEDEGAMATVWGQCDFTGLEGDHEEYLPVAYHEAVNRHDKSFCLLLRDGTRTLVRVPWEPTVVPTKFPKARIKRVAIKEVVQPIVNLHVESDYQNARRATAQGINHEMAIDFAETQRALRHAEQENQRLEDERRQAEHRAEAMRRKSRWHVAAALVVGLAGGVTATLSVQTSAEHTRPQTAEKTSPNLPDSPKLPWQKRSEGTGPIGPVLRDPAGPGDPIPRLDHREFGIGSGAANPAVGEWIKEKKGESNPPNFHPQTPDRHEIARLIAEQERVRLTPVLKGKLTWQTLEAIGVTLDTKDGVRLMLSGGDGVLARIDPHERAEIYLHDDDVCVLQRQGNVVRPEEHRTISLNRYSPKNATVESVSMSAPGDWKDPMIFTVMQWPDTPLLLRGHREDLPEPSMKVSIEAQKILRHCGYALEPSAGALRVTGPSKFDRTSPVMGIDGVTVEVRLGRVEATFVADAGFGYVCWQRYVISPTEGLRIDSRTVRQLSPRAHPPKPRAGDGILTEPPPVAGFEDGPGGWYQPYLDDPRDRGGLYPIGQKPPRITKPLPVAPAPRPRLADVPGTRRDGIPEDPYNGFGIFDPLEWRWKPGPEVDLLPPKTEKK